MSFVVVMTGAPAAVPFPTQIAAFFVETGAAVC